MIRISFWGSPAISAKLLQTLLSCPDIRVEFIVTQQDKPRSNRGRELMPTPVKTAGIERQIPVYTPPSLKKNADSLYEDLSRHDVDLNVVFAYGKIIPERFFNLPRAGTINFHASILPKLRGASPIEHALINGFGETGWTVQRMVEELDAGDIYYTHKVPVLWEDDFFSLADRLMTVLVDFAPAVILDYAKGNLKGCPQNESEATHCGKIDASAGRVDWAESFGSIRNLARAMSGRGGIYTFYNDKKIKLFVDMSAMPDNIMEAGAGYLPGSVFDVTGSHIRVVCGDNLCLPISAVQPEGKKKLTIQEFVNGYRIQSGQRFQPIV